LHGNTGSFGAAEAQAIIAQADFHRVAKGSEAEHLDFLPLQEAHFQQALHEVVIPVNGFNAAALSWQQLIQ
jgi:hypothetical protein